MEVSIPTASKLKQFRLCPRSVMETQGPINKGREKAPDGSPAAIGNKLHSCLEMYLNSRVNLNKSRSEAYGEALAVAKTLGVMPQFCSMDSETMDWLTNGKWQLDLAMTEIPMAIARDGTVSRLQYHELTPNHVLAGTADFVLSISHLGRISLIIGDWKTGLDDVDNPEENDQLLALGYMAANFFGATDYRLAVVNPVTKEKSISEMFNLATMNIDAFMKVDHKSESAGDHCRYCPLKTNCASFTCMAVKEVHDANFSGEGIFDTRESGRE